MTSGPAAYRDAAADTVRTKTGAVLSGARLSVPVRAGNQMGEILVEPGHCERLFRMAAYHAIRDGLLDPHEKVVAVLVPGRVRGQHGSVHCLATCCVELVDPCGQLAARVEFPIAVFAAFAAARAVHLLVAAEEPFDRLAIGFSVHAGARTEEPFPVAIPSLPAMSVADLAAGTMPQGSPMDDWVATFMTAEVAAGLGEIERTSRTSGVEAAGRIHTRVGYDPRRRCFVRILDRLVVSHATEATASTVVSTAASWAEFLDGGTAAGPHPLSSVHTHLHLDRGDTTRDGVPGDHLLAGSGSLPAAGEPCISINDIVSHFVVFPDPLSAALITSLYPETRIVTLYGYNPDAQLRAEPGYRVLPEHKGDS